jgi:CheY-like chemotaxis protein
VEAPKFTETMQGKSAAAGGGVDRPLAGATILLVEDEPDLRELLTETLAHSGAKVCAAASAEEALSALDGIHADAMVADIGLPGIDGIEMVRIVRQRSLELGGAMPAIALTGYARAEDRDEVLDAGYHVHLTKPVDAASLVTALTGLLKRQSAR